VQVNLRLNSKRERIIEPVAGIAQAAQAPADDTLSLCLLEKLEPCRSQLPRLL
jgi:hypothetical protein